MPISPTFIISIRYSCKPAFSYDRYRHSSSSCRHTRPWEALCRDPWWIFTTISLFYNIKTRYELSISQIIRISPRFAVMLLAMLLSIAFIILDILSVTNALKSSLPVGINPFWKMAFVFKCLTDSVVLDDFKTALDRLRAFKISRIGSLALDDSDRTAQPNPNRISRDHVGAPNALTKIASPDRDYINTRSPWQQEHKPGSNHVEASRHPSRDRDSEENYPSMMESFHHGPQREASDAHILRSQGSWLGDGESSGSDEYARAMREVTNTSEPTNHRRQYGQYDPEKAIGTAV